MPVRPSPCRAAAAVHDSPSQVSSQQPGCHFRHMHLQCNTSGASWTSANHHTTMISTSIPTNVYHVSETVFTLI